MWRSTSKNTLYQHFFFNFLRFQTKTTDIQLDKPTAEKKHLRPLAFVSRLSHPWPSL
ncbi:hypothetical protein HanPSC8_Chr01g0009051 [Helianthus annuus]|nr:hypothetical protein HanPSC8_Chr01g0009051 [Helianthus annuus]